MLPPFSPFLKICFKPFPNKPWFLRVCSTSLLKTLWNKEKLLVTSNFSFSHSVFYLFRGLSAIFIKFKIVVCKLFQFGKNLKFFVWGRSNRFFSWVIKNSRLSGKGIMQIVVYFFTFHLCCLVKQDRNCHFVCVLSIMLLLLY